jgi:glycine/D-amino acid oxidase-like deaminating enzyme
MNETVSEEARDIALFDKTDVLVAGGGLAGFAAALSAARTGARTILLERNGCLGGVATATLMSSLGNRLTVADGAQVVHGIAGEVVDRLVAAGGASPRWRNHKAICMDSERLRVILIDLLEEAGVTTLTHAMACQPILEDREVKGCFFESKSGRLAIVAPNTVDCTGEADLAFRAGAEIVEHRASSSLLFKLRDVDIDRFLAFLGQDPEGFPQGMDGVRDYESCARLWREDGVFFFPHHGGKRWRWLQETLAKGGFGEWREDSHGRRLWWKDIENIEALGMYTHRRDGTLHINTGYWCFDKIEIGALAKHELQAQQFAMAAADYMIRTIPGFEKARVEHVGVDLGLRGGRYVKGRTRLTTADFTGSRVSTFKDDVIATAPIMSGQFFTAAGVEPGSTCDIPFGSCVPNGVARLLVGSGKSVDAEGGNSRLYRGMSGCMVYGQATGTAAALAARRGIPAGDLPIRELQRELVKQGVRLGAPERLKALGLA